MCKKPTKPHPIQITKKPLPEELKNTYATPSKEEITQTLDNINQRYKNTFIKLSK